MSIYEECAKKRICYFCGLPVPYTARMKWHHDDQYDCIRLLREQVEAMREIKEIIQRYADASARHGGA